MEPITIRPPARSDKHSTGPDVTLTGATAVVRSLEELGVEVVFGIPGGAILPLYDPLLESRQLRHILVRHEQDAGHAATGYAQVTGRVGVCVATSGPGATNLLTPLADAQADSVPLVAITGQVSRGLIGTDAFQEVDTVGMTMPITKHNVLVTDPADIGRVIAEAFHIAATGRPGVVLVDIPKDVLQAPTNFCWPPTFALPGYLVSTQPSVSALGEAADLIAAAKAPVLYVGGGVVKADAAPELSQFVELTGIPVVTTLMALGAFPDSHRLHYGMPGMHGNVAAVAALQKSDVLIAVGARFDDRVTGRADTFARKATVIHVDIDPAEIGKNRAVDVALVGDCRQVLQALIDAVHDGVLIAPDLAEWHSYLDLMKSTYAHRYERLNDDSLSPQMVIEAVGRAAGPDAVYTSGVGQHQMWAAHYIGFERPRSWLNSGGLGTMGYAIPAALGAKLGAPDREVWAIDGDGCFQMTFRELATAAIENIPIKVAVINNSNLGMVKQLQTMFYDARHAGVDLATQTRRIPDFVALAEALGCVGIRCEREDDVQSAIAAARAVTDRPVVVDFVVNDSSLVWPSIAAGASNDEIMAAMDVRPLFDADED